MVKARDGNGATWLQLTSGDVTRSSFPEFAFRLQQVATDRGLSVKGLSDASGIDYTLLWRYAKGKSLPCVDNLAKLCLTLQCSVDYLLARTEAPVPC